MEKPKITFDTPALTYDQLESQLEAYERNPEGYKHDEPSIISIRQGIRAGRAGSVAVGGCLLHHDKLISEIIIRLYITFTHHRHARVVKNGISLGKKI